MVADKIIDRIEKLLRTAAAGSGAADAERDVATKEIVRLILDHSISLRPPKQVTVAKDAWVLNLAPYYAGCLICGERISPRDAVWIRVTPTMELQFRHNYGRCAVT